MYSFLLYYTDTFLHRGYESNFRGTSPPPRNVFLISLIASEALFFNLAGITHSTTLYAKSAIAQVKN